MMNISQVQKPEKCLKLHLKHFVLGIIKERLMLLNYRLDKEDRLCRFAFELIEFIFESNNVKLLIIDTKVGESGNNELVDDILI